MEVRSKDDKTIVVNGLNRKDVMVLEVNQEINLHILRGENGGYLIEVYKHLSPEDVSKDHDYNLDFISGLVVEGGDLEPGRL